MDHTKTTAGSYDFGLIGLGVMGRNFILNVADNGYSCYGYDLNAESVQSLIEERGNTAQVNASTELSAFVRALSHPRKIMLLVPAGAAVDSVIDSLVPLLERGDLIIDGGNSFFEDTDRREERLARKGIHFLGTGVSGGARGARNGPSIMPGGSPEAYEIIRPVFEAAAAKYQGVACVDYMGVRSAGNYVKMVHNGIEYGLMQLISEVYALLKHAGELSNLQIREHFAEWNSGRLSSFLLEISANILGRRDPLKEGGFLLDAILDKAKQKGTGKWTSQNAMDLGIAIPTIDMAVSMRQLSALKEQRTRAAGLYHRPVPEPIQPDLLVKMAEETLYFGYIVAYSQGLHLLREASKTYDYGLDPASICRIWRAGCIIRAEMLNGLSETFDSQPDLEHVLLDEAWSREVGYNLASVRDLLSYAIRNGFNLPALNASLSYFYSFSQERMPLNMVQAQRDYFGSHTFERLDREGSFHEDWEV